jgi:hypothetical protein
MAEQAQQGQVIDDSLNSEPLIGSLEEEVLLFLYNHPDREYETATLAFNLRAPNVAPDELPQFDEAYNQKQRQDLLAMQHAVESLILAQCVEGKRETLGSAVQFTGLKLTRKGEEEAIRAKRNLQKLPSS